MMDDILLGPVMTGQNYLAFLQNGLPELEDVPLAARIAIYLQHDGAPSGYTLFVVIQNLCDIFPNW
jgi:hypothetical protein